LIIDNRAWLAAELYRTTCNLTFGVYYASYLTSIGNRVPIGGNEFTAYDLEAGWAFYYSVCPSEPSDFAQTRNYIRQSMKSSVYGNLAQTRSNPYINVGRMDVPMWIGWGSFSLNSATFMGVLGWFMFSDKAHLDWMSLSMDTVLGANPLAISTITGLGTEYPMDPLQGQSRSDNVTEPIPGWGVFGPMAHVRFWNAFYIFEYYV
jgi:endoglucanase